MQSTKTGRDQVIDLDPEQVAVLRWHVERLEHENKRRDRRAPDIAASGDRSCPFLRSRRDGATVAGSGRPRALIGAIIALAIVGIAVATGELPTRLM